MAYDFKAGTLSVNGLVYTLGVTAEKESGLLTVADKTSWLTTLAKKGYTTGPTGAWKTEWLSVYQYLDYGFGTCYVGGTGSTGGYTAFSMTNTPLHNSSLVNMDVVFDCGTTFSAGAAKHIAQTRQDCVALIGNKSDITNISATYVSSGGITNDFGITTGNSEYVAFIAGRKQIDTKISAAWPSSYITLNMSPDIAGLLALNSNNTNILTVVAGQGTTKSIKNAVSLTQYFSDADATNLTTNNVNPIRQYPGSGIFLMGNKTFKNDSNSAVNRLNVSVLVNSIKRTLSPILRKYLFTENNQSTRSLVYNDVTTSLSTIFTSLGTSTIQYAVQCDADNNLSPTVLQVDVRLTIPAISETITLTIINNDDGTTISSTTIS